MTRTLLVGVAAAALLLPGGAPALGQERGVTADMDGDGRPDPVSLQQVSDSSMLLRVGLPGEFVDAKVPGNAGGRQPVPVDVNGDGFDEVLVPEAVGANTVTYVVWAYSAEAGLFGVPLRDGAPWRIFEGGGATAVSTYGCGPGRPGRVLDSVNAYLADDGGYRGERVTYQFAYGVAGEVYRMPISGVGRDDPALQADPATCAPLDGR
ncbi:hypothetical protein GCM10011581_28370 [Saccharopolyspora subtropica]|uniref:VCBS repeat-containing protein n=1 Tax=Saccharopolyspora thermophila TaxID=89367 RepID=A0A917JXU3_9PSEU|nr:VCBS repeat-containing protein [Saccharopolyspora subtropica]GGI89567.1 hypothetical protein GCM10011581_28370 [Saccharopolyspora subtropica]